MKLAKLTNAWIRSVLVSVLVFSVVACTSTPAEKLNAPNEALKAGSKYALMWIKPCQSKLFGGCDPDDGRSSEAKLAIHGAPEKVDLKALYEDDVGLSASIARIDASDILQDQFLRKVKRSLSARQIDAIALANPMHEGALQKISSKRITFNDAALLGATQFPLQVKANSFEFSPLYQQLDVDYLIVMELLRFNIERHYGLTGKPVSNPLAVSAVRLYLHERATGDVLFDDYAYKAVKSDEGWDQPPHYQALTDSLKSTLQAAIEEAQSNLLR